ncbi:MAG: flagellar export chaperone FliS, partial [Burkholderiaceae bacterium]
MFGSPSRLANAYGAMAVETAALGADRHQLIGMLLAGVQTYIGQARQAIRQNNLAQRAEVSSKANRLINEGLVCALDRKAGGQIAASLFEIYDYCQRRLLHAQLHGDDAAYAEVSRLIGEIQEGWRGIGQSPRPAAAVRAAVEAAEQAEAKP